MFYDERIENARGKIARNAILISFIISLVLGGINCANIFINASFRVYYWLTAVYIAIIFGSAIILAIGFIRGKTRKADERTVAEQNIYYNRSASILIKLVLSIFAVVLPIEYYIDSPFGFIAESVDNILYALLFIVGVYVVYSFRRENIYFNYSIIDSDNYYRCVWRNIGKLAIGFLCLLGISFVSLTVIAVIKKLGAEKIAYILLTSATYYAVALVAFSSVYFLYSFLERTSYRCEKIISSSTVLSLGITIFIYAVYTASFIFLDNLPITQASTLRFASIISPLVTYVRYAFMIFLTYFVYEYQKEHKNNLVLIACSIMFLSETLSAFACNILSDISLLIFNINNDTTYYAQALSTGVYVLSDMLNIAHIVGFVLIIFALVKDKFIHKTHRFSLGVFAILGGIELFLRTQADVLQVNIYHTTVEIIVLCYFAVLVSCVSKKTKQELQ
jgi:hypothetical protein